MRKCGRGEGNEGAWENEKREIYEEKGKRGSTGRQNNDRQEETNTSGDGGGGFRRIHRHRK